MRARELAKSPHPDPAALVAARVLLALQGPPTAVFGLVVAVVSWGTNRTSPWTAIAGLLLLVGCAVVPLWSFLASFLPERGALVFIALIQGLLIYGAVTWATEHPTADALPVGYFAFLPLSTLALVLLNPGARRYFHWQFRG